MPPAPHETRRCWTCNTSVPRGGPCPTCEPRPVALTGADFAGPALRRIAAEPPAPPELERWEELSARWGELAERLDALELRQRQLDEAAIECIPAHDSAIGAHVWIASQCMAQVMLLPKLELLLRSVLLEGEGLIVTDIRVGHYIIYEGQTTLPKRQLLQQPATHRITPAMPVQLHVHNPLDRAQVFRATAHGILPPPPTFAYG